MRSRLDGIPLAIELSAAWVKTLSVQEIATRLDDRFNLLTGGERTSLPRQQTLKGTLDWSYGLLEDAERLLLRRVAIFEGGWTIDAAEAVCPGADLPQKQVLRLVDGLVDKSLIIADLDSVPARYRLLETTHQYVLELLLASGEAASSASGTPRTSGCSRAGLSKRCSVRASWSGCNEWTRSRTTFARHCAGRLSAAKQTPSWPLSPHSGTTGECADC